MCLDVSSALKVDKDDNKTISGDSGNKVVRAVRITKKYIPILYVIFLMLPLYSIVCYSFKTEFEIKNSITLIPMLGTMANYKAIFSDPQSYMAFINSVLYVVVNNVISLVVAVPAAYAFSRYSFLGDKHLFFWFLASRMTPPATVAIPLFQLYSTLGIVDTHFAVALAHCLFTVPVAVWILEGFISAVPRELDEIAQLDGYSFPQYFIKILIPAIAPGIGVTSFFCFIFSWVEILLANWLTTVNAVPFGSIILRAGTALGLNSLGSLSAMAVLAILPGVLFIYFVRDHLAKGFALGQIR
ncbi:MAG: carbohydrate ABC transporter permease [Deltaproteobacteria bacterium]|nr:carbohydrate ABC transporter permease [Deltaproteobacteria bacterium]